MNKIKITLKESGTIADLSMNFKIYQGSAKNVLLNVLVPKSIVSGKLLTQYVNASGDIQVQNGMYTGVKLGMVYIEHDGKLGKTQNYYIRYLKEVSNSEGEFLLYERLLPTEFCLNSGTGLNAPKLVINVENILNNITVGSDGEAVANEPTVVSLITSQTCNLDIYPSTNLDIDPPAEPSELDLINAEVDALVQETNKKSDIADTVLKYNVLEDLPNTILYDKDGYKSIGVLFYNETYTVPITKNTNASKQGNVMVTDIRQHNTEQYWVLQDETFTYDMGAVKRTITINAVQQDIGQYTVVSVGEWQPVNSDWLNEMDARVAENSADIDSLMGRSSRYVVHLGDNTSPNQEELQTAYEETSGLDYNYLHSKGLIISERGYNMLFEDTVDDANSSKAYWLASSGVYAASYEARFSLGIVDEGKVYRGCIYNQGGVDYHLFNSDDHWCSFGYAVRPVIILNSNVTVNDVHKIADQTEQEWHTTGGQSYGDNLPPPV